MLSKKIFFLSILIVFFSRTADARTGEAEFLGAKIAGEEISLWLDKLKNRPSSVAIFNIRVAPPLEKELARVMESEISKNIKQLGNIRVLSCQECRTPKISVDGDRLIITKGMPDLEAMKNLGKKLNSETFMVIDIFRTSLSLIAQVNLYQIASTEVMASESFRIPSLSIADAAMQIVLMVGPGVALGGDGESDSGTPPLGAALMVLEEIGFGKGGLTAGYANASNNGFIGYINPTLGWRGRFGSSVLHSMKSVGIGYGFGQDKTGLSIRAAYDVFISSFTNVGVEAVALAPLKEADDAADTMLAFIGIHIGFSLGR